MQFPAAVIAAMALCNQHVVATRNTSLFITSGTGISYRNGCSSVIWANGTISGCKEPTEAERKASEDAQTAARFRDGYAWENEFQDKCSKIYTYLAKLDAEVQQDATVANAQKAATAKAAEQPTLDKGIAALSAIRK